MATKKELIQAQSYSRRRLLTAFVSGTPGGKELEPAKPLRAVIAGISLAVLLVVGSLIFGLINPGLPNGWNNNTLLLAKDTGARYVAINGVLYPVINTTSAQLVIPASDFRVLTVDEGKLSGVDRGDAIGILGAPDSLPRPDNLINSGWASCVVDDSRQVSVLTTDDAIATPTDNAILATDGNFNYLVVDGYQYQVSPSETAAVLRAIGMDSTKPIPVSATWLNLFNPGSQLTSLTVPAAGTALPQVLVVGGRSLPAGSVVHPEGSPADTRYVLTAAGELAPLSPFAYQLYLLGSGSETGAAIDVTQADIAALSTASLGAAPVTWPQRTVTPAPAGDRASCALFESVDGVASVRLGAPVTASAIAGEQRSTIVTASHGALVRATGAGEATAGNVFVIDSTGTAFPVPDASDEILARLGYTPENVVDIPRSWISLFRTGPALTEDAAKRQPSPAGNAAG